MKTESRNPAARELKKHKARTGNSLFGAFDVAVAGNKVFVAGFEDGLIIFDLFHPPPPSLTIRRTGPSTVTVSWPATATNFVLQQNTNSVSSINWSNITSGIQNDGTTKSLVVNPASGTRFYRLMIP